MSFGNRPVQSRARASSGAELACRMRLAPSARCVRETADRTGAHQLPLGPRGGRDPGGLAPASRLALSETDGPPAPRTAGPSPRGQCWRLSESPHLPTRFSNAGEPASPTENRNRSGWGEGGRCPPSGGSGRQRPANRAAEGPEPRAGRSSRPWLSSLGFLMTAWVNTKRIRSGNLAGSRRGMAHVGRWQTPARGPDLLGCLLL